MVVEAIECSRILCVCVFCLSRRRRYSASTRVCVQSYRFQYGIGLKTSKKNGEENEKCWRWRSQSCQIKNSRLLHSILLYARCTDESESLLVLPLVCVASYYVRQCMMCSRKSFSSLWVGFFSSLHSPSTDWYRYNGLIEYETDEWMR